MTAAAGHVIFNTTLSKFQFYDGSNWLNLQDELDESEVRAMISQQTQEVMVVLLITMLQVYLHIQDQVQQKQEHTFQRVQV